MKKLIFLSLAFLFAPTSEAQVTFNKRFDFTYLGAVLTSVYPTDSCYYGIGIIADSVPPYETGSIFAKFGLEGELIFSKSLTDTEKSYGTWFNTLQPFRDSAFVAAGLTDGLEGRQTILIVYDKDGDTLSTHRYANPFAPTFDWMHPKGGMVPTVDGGLLMSNLISNTPGSTSDLYVMKVDGQGEFDWGSVLEDGSGEMDLAASTIDNGDGSFTVGLWRSNMNLVEENFTSQLGLARVTSDGEVEWEYLSPTNLGLLDGANEMVRLGDGSLVIATGKGTEIERSGSNTIYFDKHVMKLSAENEIMWEVTFEEYGANSQNRFTNLVKVSDDSGFILAGNDWEPFSSSNSIRGYFAKISHDGEITWTRKYVGIGGDNPRHAVYDIDETPDGGFIICGESRDGTNETIPPQQGWLLKLDKHGCLIPGCHLMDSADETGKEKIKLTIYPNPTSDYLNFQLRDSGPFENVHFHITDAQGRTVKKFESQVPSGTHIVPVWDWPSGIYFLQYLENGKLRTTEKFYVKR